MAFRLRLTGNAKRDTVEVYNYIAEHDGAMRADHVMNSLDQCWQRLSEFPDRGDFPKELRVTGLKKYREMHFKPYRIIYRVDESEVLVVCIADGRRDMRMLLQKRLLR